MSNRPKDIIFRCGVPRSRWRSTALRRAMAAIRRGAGPEAWIRYCLTPPLFSAGLASSAYIGDDTGDAGPADTSRHRR